MAEYDFVLVSHADAACAVDDAPPNYLSDIDGFINQISEELWRVNTAIHDNPELGYEEHKAHALLTGFMKSKEGWRVTTSAYGMDTAWIAVYDSGRAGPVVSFNVEMDALPGIGHACGHNLIATASLAGGLATAEVLRQRRLPGKVVVFGTPAEEGGGGKIRLLRAGAYKDHAVDVSLISHPGITASSGLSRTTAYTRFKVEYFGREAHAAGSPWLGINALDALVTAYNGLSVLRQQTMPGDIIQGHITDGGIAPNIIHAYAAGTFVVRATTATRLEELRRKVDACFRAGAVATGARLQTTFEQLYQDHVPNRVMAASYVRCWNALSRANQIPTDPAVDMARGRSNASTDQGNISHAMPSLGVTFAIPPGPQGNGPHSPDFKKAARTKEAFRASLRTGKALAGAAVDILSTRGLLGEVKEQWVKDMKAAK